MQSVQAGSPPKAMASCFSVVSCRSKSKPSTRQSAWYLPGDVARIAVGAGQHRMPGAQRHGHPHPSRYLYIDGGRMRCSLWCGVGYRSEADWQRHRCSPRNGSRGQANEDKPGAIACSSRTIRCAGRSALSLRSRRAIVSPGAKQRVRKSLAVWLMVGISESTKFGTDSAQEKPGFRRASGLMKERLCGLILQRHLLGFLRVRGGLLRAVELLDVAHPDAVGLLLGVGLLALILRVAELAFDQDVIALLELGCVLAAATEDDAACAIRCGRCTCPNPCPCRTTWWRVRGS